MPDQLQLRGGTTTEHNSFTGALREVTVDTTKKTLVVHDGSQAGGTPLMKESGTVDPTTITIGTGGTQRLSISNSEVVFNETSTDTDFRIEGDTDANLFYADAGNNRIGLGIASPTSKLYVNTVSSEHVITAATADTNGNSIVNILSAGTTGNSRILFSDTAANDGIISYSHNDRALVFGTAGTTEDMRIDSSGRLLLGATSSDQSTSMLQVKRANNSIIRVASSDATATNFAAIDFAPANSIAGARISGVAVGTFGSTSAETAFLKFETRNAGTTAERMRIDSSGNVGIGTTSPAQTLDVNGTIQGMRGKFNTDANFNSGEFFGSSTTGQSFGILVDAGTNSSDYVAQFRTQANDPVMYMRGNGMIGIGTTNPGTPVEIRYATATHNILAINRANDDAPALMLGNNSSNNALIASNNTDLLFGRDNSGTFAERMRMLNGGKFLIGTTSGGDASSPIRAKQGVAIDSSYTDFLHGCYEAQVTINSGGADKNIALLNGWDGGIHGVSLAMMYDGGYSWVFGTNNDTNDRPTQRATLRKDGQFIVGAHDSIGGSNGGVRLQDPNNGTCRFATAGSGQITYIQFINGGSITGSISGGSSSTAYNTSSDYRLKENETAITDGITRLKQLKPYRFNWKSDSSTIVDGFFAHEVSSIVPESITGTKDAIAVEDDVNKGLAEAIGDPIYQNIDQSKLVPLLVAAVKELIGKVETLEAA